MATELQVHLNDVLVGMIRRAEHHDEISFSFDSQYLERPLRPVLGQWFLDHLGETIRTRQRLPPFFSNLLPEGALRQLIARQSGTAPEREVFLLAELGNDLPGAVRVTGAALEEDAEVPPSSDEESRLKFSLAGIQLKFSVVRAAGKLTLPASGQGGDWLIKIPDPQYPDLPENEWSMLHWAARVGIEVPEATIVSLSDVEGLPVEVSRRSGRALALRRFDRQPNGPGVHIEDFAQVLNVYPTSQNKYKTANYETIGKIVLATAGGAAFEEFVRRLVFTVAIGNGDAHIKNWSLRYADGITADLSPAYDLVSTIQYSPDDDLGLNLNKTHDFGRVGVEAFKRLGSKAGCDESKSARLAEDAAARIRSAWAELQSELPLGTDFRRRLEEHWRRVPLMNV